MLEHVHKTENFVFTLQAFGLTEEDGRLIKEFSK